MAPVGNPDKDVRPRRTAYGGAGRHVVCSLKSHTISMRNPVTFLMSMKFRLLAAGLALLAFLTTSATARADTLIDWDRILVQLDSMARTGNPLQMDKRTVGSRRKAAVNEDQGDPDPKSLGNAWFGVAPKVTLVARDWASSTRLAGDRLSVLDGVRLAASTRMVVGRARLSNARFTPFIQTGIGQWRVDRNYLPLTPRTIEVAAQLGGGFEMRITRRWQIAFEATGTTLIRDGSPPMSPAVPRFLMWGTMLASSIQF